MEIPGGGGSTMKPLGTENPGGWGVKLEKPSMGGGYGYFLEPHIVITFVIINSSYMIYPFCVPK